LLRFFNLNFRFLNLAGFFELSDEDELEVDENEETGGKYEKRLLGKVLACALKISSSVGSELVNESSKEFDKISLFVGILFFFERLSDNLRLLALFIVQN